MKYIHSETLSNRRSELKFHARIPQRLVDTGALGFSVGNEISPTEGVMERDFFSN